MWTHLPVLRAARVLLVLTAALAALGCGGRKRPAGGEVRVAAASDLARAFEEVGKAFQAETGITPVFTFGSTGLLAKQIEQGAPFDLFAAANVAFADQVVRAGACDGATQARYARGRIVSWSSGQAPARLEDLADPRWKTIAIANPEHAPYGRAAKEALTAAGVWGAVEKRLVFGENILQTMQYAKRGDADVAIVALSLAVVADGGTSHLIDDALHAPLDQALVVCGGAGNAEAARRFAAFVASPRGREIMTRYGFVLPDAPPARARGAAAGPGAAGAPAGLDEAAVRKVVDAWLAAQNGGDFAGYEALYATRFEGVKRVGPRTRRYDRKGWLADRGKMFRAPMTVTAEDVAIDVTGGMAVVRLRQTFAQGTFRDTGDKQLVVVKDGAGPRIAREEMLRSIVLEGPGSPKASGFAILDAGGRRFLVVGEAAGVRTLDDPTMLGAGPADYVVAETPTGLGDAWTRRIGQRVTTYPTGASCAIAGYRVLHLLTPHFGTQQAWGGDLDLDGEPDPDAEPLDDAARAREVAGGGGASYLVADLGACGGGDVVGVIGAGAPWAEVPDDALASVALAAFRALDGYRELQQEYARDHGGAGEWTEDGGPVVAQVRRSPDGKATYVLVATWAGSGCGDFAGALAAVFPVKPDGSLGAAMPVVVSHGEPLPTTVVDTNRDGRPELAGLAALWAWNGKAYEPAYQLDLGFRDCGC